MQRHRLLQAWTIAVVIADGVFVCLQLFGLLMVLAFDGGRVDDSGLLPPSLLLVGSGVVVASAVGWPSGFQRVPWLPYAACGVLLLSAIWCWLEIFSLTSAVSPPPATFWLGGLGFLNGTMLAMTLGSPVPFAVSRGMVAGLISLAIGLSGLVGYSFTSECSFNIHSSNRCWRRGVPCIGKMDG